MALDLTTPQPPEEMTPRIVVIGVGGAGGNAVNNMIHAQLEGVDFIAANTDAQALGHNAAPCKIQLGAGLTKGLGAGARPGRGLEAAEETLEEIKQHLEGVNMLFITAGMGGGTGTGAAPVIARAARDAGILTVGVVTKPFHFEGAQRMRIADQGIEDLQQYVDTLIVIPNQNLFRIATEKTSFAEAFKMADNVLYSGVRGVTDLMVMPGLINLDFADIRTVMSEMGKAMMGTGEAEGDDRAKVAAEAAISNPLLDNVSMKGARGILINITGGPDLTLYEVDEAANRIREEVEDDTNIIFGSIFEPSLEGRMRVSVVATGIDGKGSFGNHAEPPIRRERPAVATPAPQPSPTGAGAASAVATDKKPPLIVEDEGKEQTGAAGENTGRSDTLFDLPRTAGRQQPAAAPTPAADGRGSFIPPRAVTAADMQKEDPMAVETAEPAAAQAPLMDQEPEQPVVARVETAQQREQALQPPPQATEPRIAVDNPAPAKRESFLHRLTRRIPLVEDNRPPRLARPAQKHPQPSEEDDWDRGDNTAHDEESERKDITLEIPTFLRRQAN